ncbi:MAG: acyl-CoA thioesterase-1 [Flavobacteriales bacterium]|jgi:acyl-CoA thioesterase-1
MTQINKHLQIFTVLIITLLLNGCGEPKLSPITQGGTILAFGDSLTVGVGTKRSKSYPAVLAELTGLNVVNAGVSGETTDRGLERLPMEIDRTTPDLIILIEGGNDILQNKKLSHLKQNLTLMIELAENRGIPVILIGIPKKSLFSNSAPLYEELAEQFNLVYDGNLIADLIRSPSLKSDQIHFNEKGYRKMAESIFALLEDNGALP